MLDLALAMDSRTLLAASTDRTVSLFDPRTPAPASATLPHPATPACVAPSPTEPHKALSGAYDGIVRVWDLRAKGLAAPIASFKPWDHTRGVKKVLAVEWGLNGMVGIGGQGGFEIWKIGEGDIALVPPS